MRHADPDAKRELLAISEKDIFEEARDRMQVSLAASGDDRNLAKEDLLFAEGEGHWDDPAVTTASAETPELTINLTDALVQRVVNNMKQQRPRGKCHPVGDGANIDTAETINGIGRHVEYRSEASVAYDTAGNMAVRAGWGYCRLVAEYVAPDSFDMDLRILPIRNIFTVYDDPGALMPTGRDRNWLLIALNMARAEYRRLYPRADNASWSDGGRNEWQMDWEDKEQIRLAEYFRIRERSEVLYKIRRADGELYTRYKGELAEMMPAGDEIIDERESSRRQVEWFRLNGTRIVDREILPGTLIPVFRCEGNAIDIDGKVRRRGMVRSMKDPQRMVDYGETAKILRLGLSTKAKYMAAEGQVEDHPEWTTGNIEPITTLIYKPVTVETGQGEVPLPPPQPLPPAQLEAGFAEFTQGMRSNLLAIAGAPNEPGQDAQGQVVSGRALQRRQALSDQSHFQYYDNQTLMIAELWRCMLEWIPHYYSEERMQRIIGEDGVPQMVKINEKTQEGGASAVKNDLSVGRYDVVMDTGPGYDTKREEGAENLIQLLSIPILGELVGKVGADLVFRSLDHPYMQELADRLSAQTPDGLKKVMEELPSRARSIVQALANQNQQLQQALQAAQSGIAKAHLAATVKAHDVEESNKTRRLDTLVRAHTTLQKEEIAAGAHLLGKHVDGAQAERMIQAGERAQPSGQGD